MLHASAGAASAVLGRHARPFRATLFDKRSGANWLVAWHQDTALPFRARTFARGWGPWSLKAGVHYAHAPAHALSRVVALRLHLDDCTEGSGPLRVLPGTHTLGVLDDHEIAGLARSGSTVCRVAGRGDAVWMRPLLVHASSKLRDARRRRVLHIEYASALSLGDGMELAVA